MPPSSATTPTANSRLRPRSRTRCPPARNVWGRSTEREQGLRESSSGAADSKASSSPATSGAPCSPAFPPDSSPTATGPRFRGTPRDPGGPDPLRFRASPRSLPRLLRLRCSLFHAQDEVFSTSSPLPCWSMQSALCSLPLWRCEAASSGSSASASSWAWDRSVESGRLRG